MENTESAVGMPTTRGTTSWNAAPPEVTNGAPPTGASAPPPPSAPPRTMGGIEVRISKKTLWVGGAAYPLANIARVYTFTLHPRRKDATVHFLKMACIILAVAAALTILGGITGVANPDLAGTIIGLVWWGSMAALVFAFVQMMLVLSAETHYVLAVETSGPSTAVVTSRDPSHLHWLVGQITHAIDNPETELYGVRVDTITISPKNYYFGDNVNMYGGSSNVGITTR